MHERDSWAFTDRWCVTLLKKTVDSYQHGITHQWNLQFNAPFQNVFHKQFHSNCIEAEANLGQKHMFYNKCIFFNSEFKTELKIGCKLLLNLETFLSTKMHAGKSNLADLNCWSQLLSHSVLITEMHRPNVASQPLLRSANTHLRILYTFMSVQHLASLITKRFLTKWMPKVRQNECAQQRTIFRLPAFFQDLWVVAQRLAPEPWSCFKLELTSPKYKSNKSHIFIGYWSPGQALCHRQHNRGRHADTRWLSDCSLQLFLASKA